MTHTFGLRNDSINFHDYYRRFYKDIFFPYLREEGIDTVIQTGDLFDRRKFINYHSLELAREYFFEPLRNNLINMITYIGNHDIYYKNTLQTNAPELLLGEYIKSGTVRVIKEPTTIQLEHSNTPFDVIPWICSDNERQIKEFINKTTSKVCFGHFEISGFSMDKGSVCYEGMERSDLDVYAMVISGHFHHRSTDGHIFYVGTPYENTWHDYDDERGFHIFDTDTTNLKFIENPYRIFKKIHYDDSSAEKVLELGEIDYSEFSNCYVKVVVGNKLDHFKFDDVISKLYENHPIDVNIVEDFTEYNTLDDLMNGDVDQADDTPVIISKYIDNIEISLDKEKLKQLMRSFYDQAQSAELI